MSRLHQLLSQARQKLIHCHQVWFQLQPSTSKTGFRQVKIIKEFVWINRFSKLGFRASRRKILGKDCNWAGCCVEKDVKSLHTTMMSSTENVKDNTKYIYLTRPKKVHTLSQLFYSIFFCNVWMEIIQAFIWIYVTILKSKQFSFILIESSLHLTHLYKEVIFP